MFIVQSSDSRSEKLSKLFAQVTNSKKTVKNASDGKLFLEAICDQQDKPNCFERLIASPVGLDAFKRSMRFDTSKSFIDGTGTDVIAYLSDPALKQISFGKFLEQLLDLLVEPPTFWNALLQAYLNRTLAQSKIPCFAWLVLELLSHPLHSESIIPVAQKITDDKSLIDAPLTEARIIGQKIKHTLSILVHGESADIQLGPGGRHDNDFEDFRKISILPTPDELSSTETSFYRQADAIAEADPEHRVRIYLDNQFRLLREDMLGELRADLKIARENKKGRRSLTIDGLLLDGFDCGDPKRRKACRLEFACTQGIPRLTTLKTDKRKKFLIDEKRFLKNQSLGCLLDGNDIIAFAVVDREINQLIKDPPILTLEVATGPAFEKILLSSRSTYSLTFMLVDTAIFSYEPILQRLQEKTELALSEELLFSDSLLEPPRSTVDIDDIIKTIERTRGLNLQFLLGTKEQIDLDPSQTESLLAGLTQRVSLIQGPPGTGKSFIGALIALLLYKYTKEKIMVQCYTNHALDQFLEDLMDIGIPQNAMLRLGSKSSDRTKCLSLSEQRSTFKRSYASWSIIDGLKGKCMGAMQTLGESFVQYQDLTIKKSDLLEYLEFSDDDSSFFEAFAIPIDPDDDDFGMTKVGTGNKAVGPYYLLDRWASGQNPGVFRDQVSEGCKSIWQMDPASRRARLEMWNRELLKECAAKVHQHAKDYNSQQRLLRDMFEENNLAVMKQKRIIGCTTTASAMFSRELRSVAPGILLVEEAGEILESHIISAMGPETKQLILIGDHKQLRPKVNNYELTMEKGNGYNLNMSTFERLVLSGFPHCTLLNQHRMAPEISALVKRLTYPELSDAPRTQNRPHLRGFQQRVIFFNHKVPEATDSQLSEIKDEGSKASKKNQFEAEMVLAVVRYLGQQGYGTQKLVILTPYLGQLQLLRLILSKEHDPILNDLDSFDLVRAGLLSAASAGTNKQPIKISTIDNYQGEESEIVVASLTRSNDRGDIGFMAAPQRLNVLLSRARNGLIMIGNSNTFMKSKKGKEFWIPFFDQLKEHNFIQDGFPIKCESHPDTKVLIKTKADFERESPDGGCTEPCGTMLNCGIHQCPSRCHQLYDHSKMQCDKAMEAKCPQSHKQRWKCFQKRPLTCRKCEDEAMAKAKKLQRDHELEVERDAKQKAYAKKLADIQDEIARERQRLKDNQDDQQREAVLQQHRVDLSSITVAIGRAGSFFSGGSSQPSQSASNIATPPVPSLLKDPVESSPKRHSSPKPNSPLAGYPASTSASPSVTPSAASPSRDQWEDDKKFNGATNEHLDALMDMIGLEEVKKQFLGTKARVDLVIRQNTDLKDERFGAALLGNPGTGKTTVARLYAKFLASMGVIPGDYFVETTGARLASDGTNGCKKLIEDILNNGGGALFLDEAYQLVSGNSFGGGSVLDFLLAEIENLTGKVVFIIAGYNKQMEDFFAHNPGIPSRIPIQLQFGDYSDADLLKILAQRIQKKHRGRMNIEEGFSGRLLRIVTRRLGRGRGKEGFGNARAVHTVFSQIAGHQAKRLDRERRSGLKPDDFLFTKEDLIGPEPSVALANNAAWIELQGLIGLAEVKSQVQALLDRIQANYERELQEKPIIECSLNRVFLGSPGTGKTSVAKLYGRILADLGLLSIGEVVVKNPADFVDNVLGGSETKTKGILASTVGKVLVIDEAYMLGATSSDNGGSSQIDPYKTAVIDTIVAEVQSTAGEDRCVLLLGYKDQMESMFQNVNPGLSRRFPLDSGFLFEDFTDDQLSHILDLKLKKQGFGVTNQAKKVAMECLQRARNRPNFGNAGEVDILLDKAKLQHQMRYSKGKTKNPDTFDAVDFDKDFDRAARASTNVDALFQGTVGCDAVIAQLKEYQQMAERLKQRGIDPRQDIPFNFLFRGPPGTGKTSTARRIGKVYYDMGFLSTAEVIECSSTDLVGQYVGQTGPKTQKMFEKALGKVLFIDEAYRLTDGAFAAEAMDEIVDCLTKPKFCGKLITILAGYDAEINLLMSSNPGLSSRFPDSVDFSPLSPLQCLHLLTSSLKTREVNPQVLQNRSQALEHKLIGYFKELEQIEGWANARDVINLSKNMRRSILKYSADSTSELFLTEDIAIAIIRNMIIERQHRVASSNQSIRNHQGISPQLLQIADPLIQKKIEIKTATGTNTKAQTVTAAKEDEKKQCPMEEKASKINPQSIRDSGVSNEIWQQLQVDQLLAKALAEQQDALISTLPGLETKIKEQATEIEKLQDEGKREHEEETLAYINKMIQDAKKKLEEDRIREEIARRVNEEKKKEERVQQKLRTMGVCCMGFKWIKQAGGYRCEAGGHFVSNHALGLDG